MALQAVSQGAAEALSDAREPDKAAVIVRVADHATSVARNLGYWEESIRAPPRSRAF